MGITSKQYGRGPVGQPNVTQVGVSFETGEQGARRIYFPFPVTITAIKGIATKAIAATDNGTIQGANSTGNSTGGLITCTASDAAGTEYTATPTTNISVPVNSYYQLTPSKATAGGKVEVTLQWKRA